MLFENQMVAMSIIAFAVLTAFFVLVNLVITIERQHVHEIFGNGMKQNKTNSQKKLREEIIGRTR